MQWVLLVGGRVQEGAYAPAAHSLVVVGGGGCCSRHFVCERVRCKGVVMCSE